MWQGELQVVDFYAFWRILASIARDCKSGIYAGSSVLLHTSPLPSFYTNTSPLPLFILIHHL